MSQLRAVRAFLALAAVFSMSICAATTVHAGSGQQDAQALLTRLHELLAATEAKMIIVPFPGSRSRILKADGNSDYFLYLERANLRGAEEVDQFYGMLEAGDMDAANAIFTRHSLVSMRVSDYGWNGLGEPMMREDGSGESIQDRFYKNVDGVFGVAEPGEEDVATYLEYIETILIPALEGGS